MPSTSFAGGALRVSTPESYEVVSAPTHVDRGLPGDPGHEQAVSHDALLAVLTADGFEVVDRVDVTPRADRGIDSTSPHGAQHTVALEVDVPPGEDAVVLLETGGVYSWHLPVNPSGPVRGLEARTARFEIGVRPPTATRAPAGGAGRDAGDDRITRRDRGLLGDLVQGAVQAVVFRFVAPVVLGRVVDTLERDVGTGLVHVRGSSLDAWTPFETLDELHLPTDRPARILLLVHGTFSSTVGGFGALALSVAGSVFLENALHTYDAVIGYDHRTLSLDPRQNAADLLDRLSRHTASGGVTIDIITHSRGGLTTRSFVDELLPQSSWAATVDKIVFVAATNAGTHLADPERWCDLVDLYTNLGSVVARGLALIPGAAPVVLVVGGVLRGIGSLVKHLVTAAATGQSVPGLAAMVPGGAFVTTINTLRAGQTGQPDPRTGWFVVTSNFHVTLLDDSHRPPEFPRELAMRLGEGFIDQIFEGDNDLVVDTSAMAAAGLPGGGFVADTLDFGTNDAVYHVNYFSQDRFVDALSRWLQQGLGAAPEAAAPPPSAATDRELGPRPVPLPEAAREVAPEAGHGAERPPAEPTAERPQAEPTAERPEAEPTAAQIGAEMPRTIVVEQPFTVRVRLSRKAIVATEGSAHVEQNVTVVPDRELTAQLVAKLNAEVTTAQPDVFELPAGGGVSELTFTARALAAGPVVLLAVVRQGRVPVATLTLEATAEQPGRAGLVATSRSSEVVLHTGIDAPELDGLPCIDIVERCLATGETVYHYAVRIEPDAPPRLFESLPMRDRDTKVARAVARIDDTVRATGASPKEALAALQDIGAVLFRQFFPADLQAYLWAHRDDLADLILYADEPWVPWELVHLRPPKGPRQKAARFLGQGGLVRWQLGSFPPREILVRGGRARSICPVYADPMFSNQQGQLEQAYLHERFRAEPVTPTPTAVRTLLRSGDFDLLHFAGHGAASSDDILGAQVLLQGRRRGRTIEQQYLSAMTVSQNARCREGEQRGPLVVLNACQVGRSGELFTTVGGFAKAFLDAGASAFVSCLWSVHHEPARVFVEALYEHLLAGEPMSVASAAARTAARAAGDPTWLAYVVYARPDAVLARA